MSLPIGGLYFLVFVTIVLSRPGVNIESRIVGGSNVGPGDYPSQVSLRKNNVHFCGGSIISSSWILTAAHCIYGNSNPITAVVGTVKLSSGGTAYTIDQRICHPSYDQQTVINDVAVLKVHGTIAFATVYLDVLNITVSRSVLPITLSNTYPAAGSVSMLTGWGLTSVSI